MDYRIKPGTAIKSRLALKLVRDRVLPGSVVQAALGRQIIYGGCLDTVLLELGSMQETDIWAQLVAATGLPAPDLAMLDRAGPHLADLLEPDRAARAGIVPMGRDADTLIAICTELVQISSVRELATELGMKIALYVVPELRLELARHAVYGEAIAGRFLHLLTVLEGPEQARHTLAGAPALPAETPAQAQGGPNEPSAPDDWSEARDGSAPADGGLARPADASVPPPGHAERAAPSGIQDPASGPATQALAGARAQAAAATDRRAHRPAESTASPEGTRAPSGAQGAQGTSAAVPAALREAPPTTADIPGAESRDAILDSLIAAATTRVAFAAVLGISGHGDDRTARARSMGSAGGQPIRINGAVLALAEPSPLSVVAESGTPYLGPLGESQIARAMAEDLGRSPTGSIMILPVTIARRVVCLLYADQDRAPASLDDMEALAAYAGQAAVELGKLLRTARAGRTPTPPRPLPSPVAPTDPAIRAVPAAEDEAAAAPAAPGAGPAGEPPMPAMAHGGDERAWDEAASGPHALETDVEPGAAAPAAASEPDAPPSPEPEAAQESDAAAPSPAEGEREQSADAVPPEAAEPSDMAGPGAPATQAEASPEETQADAAGVGATAQTPDESAPPAAADDPAASQPPAGGPPIVTAGMTAGGGAAAMAAIPIPAPLSALQHTLPFTGAHPAIPALDAHSAAARATAPYGAPTEPRAASAEPRAAGVGTATWPTAITEPDDSEFCKLAANPDTAVRTSALRTLRRRLDHPEVQSFCTQMRVQARSPSPSEALTAIIALGELRDADAVPVLIDQLRSFDPSVTEAARVALTTIAKQDFGTSRWRWSGWWRRCRGQHRIEWLIEGLSHKDAEIRFSSSEELSLLTGEYFGYHFDLPKRQRDEAVRRWQEWWKVKGRKKFGRTT